MLRWSAQSMVLGIAAAISIAACAGHPGDSVQDGGDAGVDGGAIDSGAPDGGVHDAGSTDAGDAGSSDAGGTFDAGNSDAGALDAGPPHADSPAISCSDAIADVYLTPASLPAMTDAQRGDVVRCALDGPLDLATVTSEISAKGIATPMTTAVNIYRIAFRTTRGDGTASVSPARIYLPAMPRTLPMPLILIGHPTVGLADGCTPSEDPNSNRDLALPWAGLGFAVAVPDYAGQGNEGTQGYLDNRDQAHSLLDGARALRKLLSPGVFSNQILASGFSQGGGAVLSAQSLISSYGADGDLVGAIVFAPEWPTRLNSFGLVGMLEHPAELTIETGISANVVSVLRSYAYFANHFGASHAGDGFPAGNRDGISNAVNTLCETPLGGYLQGIAYHVGDTMDPALRASLLACVQGGAQGGAQGAGCVDPGLSYYNFLQSNVLTSNPSGAPVLYLQGLADYVMPAVSEAACNIDKLKGDGLDPQVCVDAAAQHQTVVARNMDFVLRWGLALLNREALPTCSSTGMPLCAP